MRGFRIFIGRPNFTAFTFEKRRGQRDAGCYDFRKNLKVTIVRITTRYLPISVSVRHSSVCRPLEQVIRGGRPVSELKVQEQRENCPPPVHLSIPVIHTQQTP